MSRCLTKKEFIEKLVNLDYNLSKFNCLEYMTNTNETWWDSPETTKNILYKNFNDILENIQSIYYDLRNE